MVKTSQNSSVDTSVVIRIACLGTAYKPNLTSRWKAYNSIYFTQLVATISKSCIQLNLVKTVDSLVSTLNRRLEQNLTLSVTQTQSVLALISLTSLGQGFGHCNGSRKIPNQFLCPYLVVCSLTNQMNCKKISNPKRTAMVRLLFYNSLIRVFFKGLYPEQE